MIIPYKSRFPKGKASGEEKHAINGKFSSEKFKVVQDSYEVRLRMQFL